MKIQKEYAKSVRMQLNHHVVWEPGFSIEIGDYGMVEDYHFKKLGSINEFGENFNFSESNPRFWEYSSSGTTTLKSDNQIGLTPLTNMATEISGQLKINFEHSFSLFVISSKSKWQTATDVDQVAQKNKKT